ncbi:MAG: hypothetical protein WAM05_15510 [Candidatus Binataceae bacterium]
MITINWKLWTQARATFIFAVLISALSCTVSAGPVFAQCTGETKSIDLGATESGEDATGNPIESQILIVQIANGCPTGTITVSGGSSAFVVSAPPEDSGYSPSCYPSYQLSGGGKCYYEVTFTPASAGPQNATTTASIDGANIVENEYGAGFTVSPSMDAQHNINNFPLMLPVPQATASPFYPGYASITLNSGNAKIKWAGKLSYQTSGQIPKPPASIDIKTFDTNNNASYTFAFGQTPIPAGMVPPTSSKGLYQVAGGQLTLNATYNAGAQNDPETNQLIGTVSGIPGGICDAAITSDLSAFMAPYTQNLFELIASQESSYRQFSLVADFYTSAPPPPPLYTVNTLWPVESPPAKYAGGYAIGLMMDQLDLTKKSETEMTTAWDWIENAQTGYNTFESKVKLLTTKIMPQVSKYSGLSALSSNSLMFEQMAVFQYAGFASNPASILSQYYIPQCSSGPPKGTACPNGTWQWGVNPNTSTGDKYVSLVYGQTPPNVSCGS